MSNCDLFDRYRDKEMNAAERSDFESHLTACGSCREKMALLDNVVRIIRQEELQPVDLAERISEQAFRRGRSWDALVLSWLRPGQALAALALALVFISFIWLAPGYRQADTLTEYEELMRQADAILAGTGLSQAGNDSEFMVWLQQEGNPQ